MLLAAPGLLLHTATGRVPAALARLARYAAPPRSCEHGLAHLVCALAGVSGEPPVAALLAAGAGTATGDDYWLVADPVTLVPGRSDVTLAGRVDDLVAAETHELLTALNAHFHDDGVVFVASRPDVWLARLRAAPALTTTPVDRARGTALAQWLPGGDAGAQWRRWQDEIQMLLHVHPVNADREARGAAPANAVWFWGGGRLADARAAAAFAVSAPPTRLGDLARGLAGLPPSTPAPARAALVVSDTLATSADAEAFVDTTLAPALVALERSGDGTLVLAADGPGVALAWTAQSPSWIRRAAARWRPRPFALPLAQDP